MAKKNEGKRFEEDCKLSVPEYALLYRLPDPPQSFGKSSNLRFSRKNPFDFILWDSKRRTLFALEMKTVKGKSISFERTKEENREIHLHQIDGLNEWNKFDGTTCGFVIEFRKIETTVFIDIETFNKLSETITKKSFNIHDLVDNDLPFTVISQKKVRTRYRYDFDGFLDEISEEDYEKKRH